MKESHSQRMRAENEVMFKEKNSNIRTLAATVLDSHAQSNLPIGFVCECSNDECRAIITMPLAEYAKLRKNDKQFIIKPGHVGKDIEYVVRSNHDYDVVEKFEAPPSSVRALCIVRITSCGACCIINACRTYMNHRASTI